MSEAVHQIPSETHWGLRAPFMAYQMKDMENFRNNGMSSGLDGISSVMNLMPFESSEYVNGENLTETYHSFLPHVPEWFFHFIMRVGTGNPLYEETPEGVKLTHSDFTCAVNAWRLWAWTYPKPPKTIVEIGGGFGCLAAMMLRMWPDAHYHGVDLEQSLVLQDYYLKEEGFEGRFTLHEDVPDVEPELVINIRSFMEMTMDQVNYYFGWLNSLKAGTMFYCVNAYKKRTRLADYPFDENWMQALNKPLIGQSSMCELLCVHV